MRWTHASLLSITLVSNQCYSFCFEEAASHYNVDSSLLRAIAMVESSMNPNAYNENKDRNGIVTSRDYGLMQINSSHFVKLSQFGISRDDIINDPCYNVIAGAWVLSSNFSTHGYNWNSVGAYNAGFRKKNQAARNIYIDKVKKHYYAP